jgi:hypothetical protein
MSSLEEQQIAMAIAASLQEEEARQTAHKVCNWKMISLWASTNPMGVI